MQATRQVVQQLTRRSAQQLKALRGMASDASAEKAQYEEAIKEMNKW